MPTLPEIYEKLSCSSHNSKIFNRLSIKICTGSTAGFIKPTVGVCHSSNVELDTATLF